MLPACCWMDCLLGYIEIDGWLCYIYLVMHMVMIMMMALQGGVGWGLALELGAVRSDIYSN